MQNQCMFSKYDWAPQGYIASFQILLSIYGYKYAYRKVSNIRRTKSQNLNASRLTL